LEIQAQIPAASAAIHNFIRSHDSDDNELQTANDNAIHDHSDDEGGPIFMPEEEVDERRDQIAQEMWEDYQQVCEERGIGLDSSDTSDDDDDV
jgi:hypothetical protein